MEQISLMKPKGQNENETGLIEYLEDIIGTNKYIEEINAVQEDVEQCNEQRIEQTNRVKASQNEMQGLEQEKQIAVDWLKKERSHLKLTCYTEFLTMHDEVRKFNQLMKTLTEVKETLKAKKQQKKDMFSENQDLIKSITDLSEELQHQQKACEELNK